MLEMFEVPTLVQTHKVKRMPYQREHLEHPWVERTKATRNTMAPELYLTNMVLRTGNGSPCQGSRIC